MQDYYINKLTEHIVQSVLDKFVDFIATTSSKNKDTLFLINEFKQTLGITENKEIELESLNQKVVSKCAYIFKKGSNMDTQCTVSVRDGLYCAKHKKSNNKTDEVHDDKTETEKPVEPSILKKFKIDELVISDEEQTELDEESILPSEVEDDESEELSDYDED